MILNNTSLTYGVFFGIWGVMLVLDILNRSKKYAIMEDTTWTLFWLYMLCSKYLPTFGTILCYFTFVVMFFLSGWWRYNNSIEESGKGPGYFMFYLDTAVSAFFVLGIIASLLA